MAPTSFRWRYTWMGGIAFPLVPVRFIHGSVRTPTMDALLDSGADTVLIPIDLAEYLGLPLERMPQPLLTAGGAQRGYTSTVDLEIGRPGCFHRYRDLLIRVVESPGGVVLLGRDPVFRDFIVTFDERHDMIVMELVED